MSHEREHGPDSGREGFDRDLDERLAAFVDDSMDEKERERFVAELRVSPQLQKDLDEYERTVDTVRRALRAETVGTDIADRVMSTLAQQATGAVRGDREGSLISHRGFQWGVRLAAAAAVFLLAVWIHSLAAPKGPTTDLTAQADGAGAKPEAEAEGASISEGLLSRDGEPVDVMRLKQQQEVLAVHGGEGRVAKTAESAGQGAGGAPIVTVTPETLDAARATKIRELRKSGEPGKSGELGESGKQGERDRGRQKSEVMLLKPGRPTAKAGPEAVRGAPEPQRDKVAPRPAETPMAAQGRAPSEEVRPDPKAEVSKKLGSEKSIGLVEHAEEVTEAAPPKGSTATGSDDFFLGAGRPKRARGGRAADRGIPDRTLPTPVLFVTCYVDPEPRPSQPQAGGATPSGPATPASKGPATKGPGSTATRTGAPAAPVAPKARKNAAGTGGAEKAVDPDGGGRARLARRLAVREVEFDVFVADQLGDLRPEKPSDREDRQTVWGLREFRLPEFGSVRIREVELAERGTLSFADAREPKEEAAANIAAKSEAETEPESVRSWVVEGSPDDVKLLLRRMSQQARQRGYGLAKGETQLPVAEPRRQKSGPEGGKAQAAEEPVRAVLQFRTVRRR